MPDDEERDPELATWTESVTPNPQLHDFAALGKVGHDRQVELINNRYGEDTAPLAWEEQTTDVQVIWTETARAIVAAAADD
jgi:hypothetical protein